MSEAKCYLSVISAFLTVVMAEVGRKAGEAQRSREKRKTSGQQSDVPQTGNGSLWMPQLLCLASP